MLVPSVCAERKASQERSGRITMQPRNMSYLQRASSRRTVQGWFFMALQLCRLLCLAHAAGGGYYLSLNMEGPATICRGATSWVRRDCQMLATDSIPTLSIGLFNSAGDPCCGEDQVAVRLKVTKMVNEYGLSGFTDKDSTPGAAGSRMTVDFTNLKFADRMPVGEFNVTISSFYRGFPLQYTTPLKILPSSIRLLPWGSWSGGAQTLPDRGPWTVHEPLPPFSLALQQHNTTVSLTSADSFMVGARLFRPVDLLDITSTSLEGTTLQQALRGIAVFNRLSIKEAAGTGYRLAFFLIGADKECRESNIRRDCEEWARSRSNGGMGGYHVEVLGPEITVVPDRLVLTPFGPLQPPWRIGETLKAYRIALYDSVNMNAVRSEVKEADNLFITASLFSSNGMDVTSTALSGTTSKNVDAGIAVFEDLVVNQLVGISFALVFSVSWRDRCVRKLVDETCSGQCCLAVRNIDIYPHQVVVQQPLSVPPVTEGDTIAQFSVAFTDFDGNVLIQVGAELGLRTNAYLLQRGTSVPEKLVGHMMLDVAAGVSTFTDLRVYEHAGRGLSIIFSDLTSKISTSSAPFDVYPRSIYFDGTLSDAVTGGSMQTGEPSGTIAILLLSSDGNVIRSTTRLDNFTVEVYAASRNGGTWQDCKCLQGPKIAMAEYGRAIFNATLLIIPSAVGKFSLQFRLVREGLPALAAESNTFNLKPQGIYIKSSSLQSEVIVGDILGLVQLGFNDDFGAPINNTGDLSTGFFTAVLTQDTQVSRVLSTWYLAGNTTMGVNLGGATFADLRVTKFAGASMRIKFVFTNVIGNETTRFEVLTQRFTVRPARLSINDTLPHSVTDRTMPSMNVSVQDIDGIPLWMVSKGDAMEVTMELYTLRYLGCSALSAVTSSFASMTWEKCAQIAVAGSARFFVTDRLATPGTGFCGMSTDASVLPSGLGCIVGCEVEPGGCSAANLNRLYYSITNSTAQMLGTRSKIVKDGSASFSDLRVVGLYGIKSSIVAVRNRGHLVQDVVAVSEPFTIDPAQYKIMGLPSGKPILSQPVPTTNVTALDSSGEEVDSVFALEAYVVHVELFHAGVKVNHRLALPHHYDMHGSHLSFALKLLKTGGSNFTVSLSIEMQGYDHRLTFNSSHFTIYPDQLVLVGPQGSAFDAYSDTTLSMLQVRCEDVNGTLITDIQTRDDLRMRAGATDIEGLEIPACAGATVSACLGGTIVVAVANGTAVFKNLAFFGDAGTGSRLNFRIVGGGPAAAWSAKFSVFPKYLYISEGEYRFNGVNWIINKGLGDYAVSMRGAAGEVVSVATEHGFVITVSLRQTASVDLTSHLAGTKKLIANHVPSRSASAIFTNLVITQATGELRLYFTISHPNSSLTVENSTNEFKAVPYALRISQKCFNGNAVNDITGTVPYGFPSLQCVGPGTSDSALGRDFGRFGYLTGYYRYENNQNIGPLLLNVRGAARIPPIDILATDLYLNLQTLIKTTHSLRINLKLFVGETQYTSHVAGNTVQVVKDGIAKFEDLRILSIPECRPNCTLLFRFNLDGVLCSDTWCTNVTMDLRDASIVAPHKLGSHPAYPGSSRISGTLSLACITQNQLGSTFLHPTTYTENQNILRHALLAASAIPFLTLDSIEIVSISTRASVLEVSFQIRAQSYAASTSIMSTVTDQFRQGSQIIPQVCSLLGKNSTFVPICAPCAQAPKLIGKLSRIVVSHLTDETFRVATPKFSPPGLPEGTCLRGEWTRAGTCVVPFGPFVGFNLDLTIDDGTTYQKVVYYTVDTCPVSTAFCNTTGSVLSDTQQPISDHGAAPLRLRIFGTSPTQSVKGLPDGLTDNEFRGYFSDDKVRYQLKESVLNALHYTLVQSGRYVAIRGNRQTSIMPEYLTVKAFGTAEGRKTASFPISSTFQLSPQASTPNTDLHRGELWVLGWCNATHSSIPNANIGDAFIRRGSCADLQHENDSSVCSSADFVPCRLKGSNGLCTAGSKSYTVSANGMYDGSFVRASGSTRLNQAFNGLADTRMYVISLNELGFTHDGALLQPRSVLAGNLGIFRVNAVRQADQSLEVLYEHQLSFATGDVVSLNNTCGAGSAYATMFLPIWTSTPGASVYFNIPGTEPTLSSEILGPTNSLAVSVEREMSFRAVAGGQNMMNSPYLHLDVLRPCGNGVINGGEQCDDGNLVDGDLCSSRCMFERKCEDVLWQQVTHENIGIRYMDSGNNHSQPQGAQALKVTQIAANVTGLTSDCLGFLLVSHVQQLQSGGRRHLSRPTSAGRLADAGCSCSVGSEVLFAGNYLHSAVVDGNGNAIPGREDLFMYDVEKEVFYQDKYKFDYAKNSMTCQAVGSKAYFAGGLKLNAAGNGYDMVDDIDELHVIPPIDPELSDESSHAWQYRKWKLSAGRTYLASAQAQGVVAFAGGIDLNNNDIFANFDVLDPITGNLNTTHMPTSRYLHAMAGVGHLILAGGGANFGGYSRSIDIYDTRHRNFTSLPNGLSVGRALLAAAATSTKVFFAGGFTAAGPVSTVDMFDLLTGRMKVVAPLVEARYLLIGAVTEGLALFGGGRRRDGLEPTGSKYVDIYEGVDGNRSHVQMNEHRTFHFGGAAAQYAVFGLGVATDPGFQNILSWLNAPLHRSLDVFDMSPVKKVIRANVTAPTAQGITSKMVTLPYYHLPTRVSISVPEDTQAFYDISDKWRVTCEPGFRKSRYQTIPESSVYTAFLCTCTNLTNFFNRPSLHPSDQAVMLRVPLPQGIAACRDLCLPARSSIAQRYEGLEVEYKGINVVDNLQITPNSANTFCTSNLSASVYNVTRDLRAIVVTASGSASVTLPYTISELDVVIDMQQADAREHVLTDTWTLKCGGNTTGFAVFSFSLTPSVCSVIVSPFD